MPTSRRWRRRLRRSTSQPHNASAPSRCRCTRARSGTSLRSLPAATAEFAFVLNLPDVHLVRITLRGARVAVSQADVDYLVDSANLSPSLQSSMLPSCTDAEFEAKIVPFSFGQKTAIVLDDDDDDDDDDDAPVVMAASSKSPDPILTQIVPTFIFKEEAMDFARTRCFTDSVLDFFIANLFKDKFGPFLRRNREVFVCGVGLTKFLLNARYQAPDLSAEDAVARCFVKAKAAVYFGEYFTEPWTGPLSPERGRVVDGLRSVLIDRNFIFFPVNHNNAHWVLYLFWRPFRARTRDEDAARIFIFDSLPGCVQPAAHRTVIGMLQYFLMNVERMYSSEGTRHSEKCTIVLHPPIAVQPPNSNACGYFTYKTIEIFLTDDDSRDAAIRTHARRQPLSNPTADDIFAVGHVAPRRRQHGGCSAGEDNQQSGGSVD